MKTIIYFGRFGQVCMTTVNQKGSVLFHCQGTLANLCLFERVI